MMRKFSGAAPPLIVVLLFSAAFSCGSVSFLEADAQEGAQAAVDPAPELSVSAVQYEVELADYHSAGIFASEMERLVARAAGRGARLLVFPEYINVFLAFSAETELLSEADSVREGAHIVFGSSGNTHTGNLHDLLLRRSEVVRRNMDRIWGRLADRHSVWIVAGSYFAAGGVNEEELYNRAVVYGPEGGLIHEQDKVHLTPFERSRVGLSAGRRRDAEMFEVSGWDCALTICRDSFFDEWNELFEEAELWIDLKANGEEFGEHTPALFAEALPERIGETGVPYGLTVCLNGEFLDLFWEGPSSIIRYDAHSGIGNNSAGEKSEGWSYVRRASSVDEPDIIVAELRFPGE